MDIRIMTTHWSVLEYKKQNDLSPSSLGDQSIHTCFSCIRYFLVPTSLDPTYLKPPASGFGADQVAEGLTHTISDAMGAVQVGDPHHSGLGG